MALRGKMAILPDGNHAAGHEDHYPSRHAACPADHHASPDASVLPRVGDAVAHASHEAGGMAAHGHYDHRDHAAHDRHAGHSVAMFRDTFWLSRALTVPIPVCGHMLPRAFGYTPPTFRGAHWISPVLGAAVLAYGGRPFLQGAAHETRDRLPGMMTPIALAISVAFAFSAAVTLGFPGMPRWEELATLVTIMLPR